jgi:small subunit ribosomal protein S9
VTETVEQTDDNVETTDAVVETEAAPREPVVIDRPIQTVGRRKEAVVRVRLVPGTGQFHLDGRTLEAYFPN